MRNLGIMVFLLLTVGIVNGQTNVSGSINKDSTWSLDKSPYVVIGNVTVTSGKILTVDSGVVVRFQENTGLYVNGTLKARLARFTSNKDTIGGNPQKGDWVYIQTGDGYTYSATATFDTCTIKYGGTLSLGADAANVFVYSGSASFTACDISFSKNYGVMFAGGPLSASVTLTNSNIFSCDWPMSYRGAGSLIFNGSNNLTGNTHNGINMRFSGNANALVLDTASVPYVFLNDYMVSSHGGKLDIAPTNILKFGSGVSLFVDSVLIANAGVGQKIYFTAYTDDNLGGDTNADGTATAPASGYWTGILFRNESMDSFCLLRRCKISFAGYSNHGGVSMANASPTIDSCDFTNNFYGVMMQDVSNPVFSNNIIASSKVVPIAMSFTANPILVNNTLSFSDNRYDAIGLLGSSTPANGLLRIRSFTSSPNITYLLLEDVTVPVENTFTINKGIVIKGIIDYPYINVQPRIIVQGKLVAVGTPDSLITFTSARDDKYGNPYDTNKDGTQTSTQIGDWGGIKFESTSDTSSIISYCRLKYGYYSGTGPYYTDINNGVITTFNASPTVSNCEIQDVNYGVYAFQLSNPKIWNDTIINSKYTPIAMSVSANPSFIGGKFTNTKWTALGIIGENLGLSGTLIQRTVAGFSNITYLLLSDLTINSGTNVTVDPGVVIKSNQAGIFVNGGFRAKGTIAGGQIIFTSIKDDNTGHPQDTNGDGNGTSPQQGDWKAIRFQSTSDDAFCLLDSCQIKFGGSDFDVSLGSITFVDASGTISNTLVSDSYNFGIRCDGTSTPLVTDVEIRNCRRDPLAMSLKSDPTFTNIKFTSNGTQGIRILEGTLSSDATLHKRDVAGIPNIAYIVEHLTISSNAVLTIDPGVVIKFPITDYYYSYSYHDAEIIVNGALIANGTVGEKIIFTARSDDSIGGDTNNDGNSSTPARGDWWSIEFHKSGNDSLNSLKNCEIRYGGSGGGTYGYYYSFFKHHGAIRAFDSNVRIDSCVVQQSSTSGIGIFGSAAPVIRNVQIYNITYTPVTMSMFSNPTFSNISTLNVDIMALGIVPETYSVSATIPKRDFGGFSNITYFFYTSDYGLRTIINSGTTITIPSGVVFKSDNSFPGILVNGGLVIDGTYSQKVVFTDVRDDNYGNPGDTNGDGSSTNPVIESSSYYINRSWIEVSDVSDDSTSSINFCVFRYTGSGINLLQASPRINNCIFDKTVWGVRLNGVSQPTLDSCSFNNLTYAPIRTSLVSYPRSSQGNSITGTTYRAIGVLEETLVQDVTLPRRSFGGVNNIPYLFEDYTIGTSSILTISPGVILKFFPDKRMIVRKGLIAEGGSTNDSLIVFTDIRDDFYGGDTNADSSASSSSGDFNSNWYGILFEDESLDPLCRLRHSVVRYAGLYYDAQYGGIVTNNSSPSITYSLISQNRRGIIAKGSSNPVINYCDISDNKEFGIQNVNPSFMIDARWNWWGSNSGPTHSGNPDGTGQTVTDNVNYSGFFGAGALNPLAGDVSLNGNIQAFDASLVLRWLADSVANPFNDIQKRVADVSGVSGITAYDASLILQYVVGKINKFPVEFNSLNPPVPILPQKAMLASIGLTEGAVEHGKRSTVKLSAIGLNNVYSADIELSFNRTQLKAVEVKAVGIAANVSIAESEQDGIVRIFIASSTPLQSQGDLVEITFEALDDVRGIVKSPVTFSKLYLNESNFKSQTAESFITITGKPIKFALVQNYPNPFNPTTTISYEVPENGKHVIVDIFNVVGQRVRELVNTTQDAGVYRVTWDGTTDNGIKAAGGMYIYRMSSGSFSSVKKMLMVK